MKTFQNFSKKLAQEQLAMEKIEGDFRRKSLSHRELKDQDGAQTGLKPQTWLKLAQT
jgi:hypothetical protein